MGGGASSPGFVGHSKYNITQRKFIVGDGGLARMVWMPKILKEEIKERIDKRGEEIGIPDLYDRIADETVGVTEEEILPFLQEKGASGADHGNVDFLTNRIRHSAGHVVSPMPDPSGTTGAGNMKLTQYDDLALMFKR